MTATAIRPGPANSTNITAATSHRDARKIMPGNRDTDSDPKKWSGKVTRDSRALELEPGVFKKEFRARLRNLKEVG